MRVIYTKEKISKMEHVINLSEEDFFKVYPDGNSYHDRPELDDGKHIVMIDQKRIIEFPTYDEAEDTIREMTKEEKILILNQTDLLADGEIIEEGKIKKVDVPENMIRPSWDKELKCWKETMTKQELMTQRKEKILKYAELKKEIETLEEFADEFESDNTIEMLKKEMEDLKKEINDLYKKIKSL